MKTSILTALSMLALVGCAQKTGVDRAAAAAQSMDELKKLAGDCNTQIDKTIASLNALNTVKSGDPKPAFATFTTELSNAQSLAASVKSTSDSMRAGGRSFFAEWEKQIETIKDAELKAKAKARADERSKEYAKIEQSMDTARGKWTSFNASLEDLKGYLQNDLNAKGIESVSGKIKQANLDSVDLKNSINVISAQLDKVSAELSPTAPPPAPEKK